MGEFGKGIPLASGFDLGAKKPLDSRDIVDTIAERDAHVTQNRAYEGMVVYVKENKKVYRYNGEEWIDCTSVNMDDIDLSDYYTKEETEQKINKLQNEIDNKLESSDLSDYAKKDDIPTKTSELTNDNGFISEIPNEYITENELNSKGYLTEHQDLSDYSTTNQMNSAINQKANEITNTISQTYTTKTEINDLIDDYYTKEEVDEQIEDIDLSNYYTKREVDEQIGDINLSNYYTKNEINIKFENIETSNGILIVNNEIERDALTDIENGELCYVKSKDEYYKYKDGIWETFSSGNGSIGGGVTEVIIGSYTDEILNASTTDEINLSFNFDTTGNSKTGRMTIIVNGTNVKTERVTAGDINVNVTKYLLRGENTVEINISDIYGSYNFIIYTINLIELSMSSVFDYTQIFNDTINITYVANGNISKTLHVFVDGKEIITDTINTSGISKNCLIPKQSHGEHEIKMYTDCTLGENTIKSNELEYHVICIDEGNNTPIIASSFNLKDIEQYTVLSIPYMVYTPGLLTSEVKLYVNDVLYSSLNVDRKLQKWGLSEYDNGQLNLKIKTGDIYKEFILNVTEVELITTEKTEGLELYLTSKNRINDENKEKWEYNDITTTFTDFTWVNDGWQLDEDGYNTLVIENNARATINIKPFMTDFKGTGKAIEFEFKVKDVIDYDAIVISCMSGNRGIEVGCKSTIFKSNETSVLTKFKEDERVRVSFSIENKNQNRLIYVYVNGILSGLTQYVDTDIFSQTDPVNITLGSNYCTLYMYNIRVYNESLGLSEALNNYIYDMNNMSKKIELITKNDIYDDYGEVSYNKLLNKIPCMIITGELPPVKGDKKIVDVQYTNKQDETRNFIANSITIDIQGTSSQYYPKKNYKIKLSDKYKLRENSVEGKVFCLKADYMESSHSHNTGMAKIVHGMYSEYVPTQTATNGVRTTIDGFPIALFHRASATSPMQYFGIYNFNDDKDNTDTFGYVSGTECWEVCNNTSKRTLFQISDYEIMGTDGNPEWYADFEARYPDKNRDYTNLKRLTDWIVSTDGDLDKFKNEFEQYFNLHYTLVYCVLTELFAMIDSRAKNMFLASWDKTIWYPVFYDMDSIFGLNNEGELVFEYNVETNDTIGTQNVYNGKNSLLWQNFENAFSEEIKETYNTLRDSDKLTYESVLSVLEGQQINILSEAQYNEDAKYKYLDPLLNDNISTYLYIAQGSRVNHLKYWLFNRFNYMDSKYIASDYKNNYATMRLYTPENWDGVRPNSNFTITPFADQYSTVKFGSYVVSERSQADTPIEIVAPNIEFNDTETIIYGADRISSLGNLADKYAGTVDMSKATQLTELIIGSNASGYSNTNLKSVSVGNNKLLRKIDIRNCPSLTAPLDLSQCDNIQEVYTTGSSITSVKFSNGTELTTLTLPNTITNLTLINKKKLTSITSEGYENLNTLRIENSAINPFTIMNASPALESVRLIGINCQTNISYLQYLTTLKGMDENGVEIPLADAVSGKITIVECSRELLEEFKITFPNVIFNVLTFTTTWNVTFKDGDGNVIYTTKALNNGEVIYLGETPTKSQTVEYNYVWKGWDRQLKPIVSDCVINATFESVLRCYTVKFINSDTLDVVEEFILEYGSTIVYPNPPEGMNVWLPLDTIVTGDMEFYSKYIFYPDDLSIFEFNSFFMDNRTQYNVTLNTTNNLSAFLIYPFRDENNHIVTSINGDTSLNVSAITDVYLPETINYLGDYAFYNFNKVTGLELLDITNFINGNNIDSACRQFYNCSSLEEIKIPKVQKLPKPNVSSDAIFKNCTNLQCVTIGSEEYPFHTWEEYSSIASEQHFYNSVDNLIFINLVTENGLESDVLFNYELSDKVKSKIIYSKKPIEMVTDNLGLTYIIRDGEATIINYMGTLSILNIPEINNAPIIKVKDGVFKNNTSLTSILLPNVTSIGNNCFTNCSKLTSVEIPKVTSLNNGIFQDCSELTSVEMPNVVTIGNRCFAGCSKLNSIEISNVTELKEYCFSNCSALTELLAPNVIKIGDNCFSGCTKLTTVILGELGKPITNTNEFATNAFPSSVEKMHIYANNATNPPTLAGIPWGASNSAIIWRDINEITDSSGMIYKLRNNEITILLYEGTATELNISEIDGVPITRINSNAFKDNTTLTSVSLPNIIILGDNCFSGCTKLTTVILGEYSNPIINTNEFSSTAFSTVVTTLNIYTEIPDNPPVLTNRPWGAKNATIKYIQSSIDYTRYFTYETVTDGLNLTGYVGGFVNIELSEINGMPIVGIADNIFKDDKTLTSISLPNIISLGNGCFNNCAGLTSIEIPNATSIGNKCFEGCEKLTSVEMSNIISLGNSCFMNCSSLISISSLSNVTNLNTQCFANCTSLTSIEIPNVVNIDDYCFLNTGLTSISLPKIQTIGNNCFADCQVLTTVTLGGLGLPITDTSGFSTSALSDNITTLNIYVEDSTNPPTLQKIPWGATNATIKYKGINEITDDLGLTYKLENNGLTIIRYEGTATELNVSDVDGTPVTKIDGRVFEDNTTITSVSFPNVTSLGESCFENCTKLVSASLPNAISLERLCFYNCDLTSIEIPNATTLGSSCFSYCDLTSIEIPNVTSIGGSCFSNCIKLKSISLLNITELNRYCFYNCYALTSIEIPNVTSLGESCFEECDGLPSISLPKIQIIGDNCFADCSNLTTVTLGGLGLPIVYTSGFNSQAFSNTSLTLNIYVEDATNPPTLVGIPWGASNSAIIWRDINEITDSSGLTYVAKNGKIIIMSYEGTATELNVSEIDGVPVTKINSNAFKDNTTLTSVSLPNITIIGDSCFEKCYALTSIEIPNATSLGQYCFYECEELTSIKIPKVTNLGENCFEKCKKLTSISLPKIQIIGDNCFADCSNLTTVTLGGFGLPIINTNGFSSTSFTTVVVTLNIYVESSTNPPTLTGSPWGATNATIKYKGSNEVTDDLGLVYEIINGEATIVRYEGTATELNVSDVDGTPVTKIADRVFRENKTITSVSFPNVTSVGIYCFFYCSNLTSILLPNVTSIGNNCFTNCFKLTSAEIPNVVNLGDYCFSSTGLTSISLPNVVNLGNGCFSYCSNLTTVTLGGLGLPITNTSGFNTSAFSSYVTTLNIYVESSTNPPTLTGSPWGATSATIKYKGINEITDDLGLVYELKNNELTIVKYEGTATELNVSEIEGVPVTAIVDWVFEDNKTITSVSFPNVTSLGGSCFYGCSNLTSVEIPNATSLDGYCFFRCTKLTSIELPNATRLGESCFMNCSNLTSISLPNVINIDSYCFLSTKLTSISLPKIQTIGDECFKSLQSLTTVTLPNVTSLGRNCFRDCTNLTSVEIPNATSLGQYCFRDCGALSQISLPKVTSIGGDCFYGCSKLTTVTLGGLGLPITNTSGFSSSSFTTAVTTLIIHVNDASKPPTLTGSPWGATSATIKYKGINEITDDLGLTYKLENNRLTIVGYEGTATELNVSEINGIPVTAIDYYVFENNTTITSVSFPNVTSLGYRCFYKCSNLTSAEIPNVDYIDDYCFYRCSKLTPVEIPKVTSLGGSCFRECTNFTSIELPKVTTMYSDCFYGCTKLTTVTLGGLGLPITNTSGFSTSAFGIYVTTLNIYVNDASKPPTLTGSPWGAKNATIKYQQS